MPVITIYHAQIDGNHCSGMLHSFKEIKQENGPPFRILPRGSMRVQTPPGFDLETIKHPCPYGDDGFRTDIMLFDPTETGTGRSNGRVYMRAARVIRRLDDHTSGFYQV